MAQTLYFCYILREFLIVLIVFGFIFDKMAPQIPPKLPNAPSIWTLVLFDSTSPRAEAEDFGPAERCRIFAVAGGIEARSAGAVQQVCGIFLHCLDCARHYFFSLFFTFWGSILNQFYNST